MLSLKPPSLLPPITMTREKLIEFLQRADFINAAQAAEIASSFLPIQLRKNDVLQPFGRVSDAYLFLDYGLLRAFVLDPAGNEVTTHFYSSRHVALDASSFFNRTPAQQQIHALTECLGWVVSYQQLNSLFHARPEFREFGRSVLVQALSTLQGRMLDQIRETARTRYEKLLATSPEVFQHAPLKYIASYLGITDSSLSRIRGNI
jgi:CRP-like cAMP-binding protein